MTRRAAVLLVLLLLAARSALVLSLSDVFFYGEELGKGAAAKAILDRVDLPYHQLNYAYHEGGGFLVTHLKALAFLLVGENLLAHKLVALLTTSILLLVCLRLVSEHFGARAAAVFGLLFVFCPGPWQRFSLLSLGTHFEALVLIALILHFTLRILREPGARAADWAWLGACAGLGLYFSLQCAAAAGAAGLALLLGLRRGLLSRGPLVAAAGFILGAAPLWWMMSHVGLAAIRVQGHPGLGQGASGWAAVRGLLRPLLDEPDPFAWAWALAAVAIAPTLREKPARPILGYLAVFLALYLFSGFAIDNSGHWFFWVRLSPVWFCASVLISAGLARWMERGGRRRGLALGACGVLVIGGVGDFAGILLEGRPGSFARNWWTLCRTKGYDYSEYLDKLVHHFEESEEDKARILLGFRDDPRLLAPAIAHSLFERSEAGLEESIAISRRAFGPDFQASLLGLGLNVSRAYGRDLPEAFERIDAAPPDTREALAEALGRVAFGLKIDEDRIDAQCRQPVPARHREAFLRGAGWRAWKLHRLRPDRAMDLLLRQPADQLGPLLEGYVAAREAIRIPRPPGQRRRKQVRKPRTGSPPGPRPELTPPNSSG